MYPYNKCNPEVICKFACKTDKNYIPSKTNICDPKAEALLGKALMSTQIYKSLQDYIY
jgi:hypothetical protein